MPWPKALENISDSPGAVVVNMPGLEFNICGEITQFTVDDASCERNWRMLSVICSKRSLQHFTTRAD